MQALEVPYVNLFFHRECLVEIEKNGDFYAYLTENAERIYNNSRKISQDRRTDGKIEVTNQEPSAV